MSEYHNIITSSEETLSIQKAVSRLKEALAHFEARFRDGAIPENMPEVTLAGAPVGVLKVLREAGLVASGAEAQRNDVARRRGDVRLRRGACQRRAGRCGRR